jgi:hypothetical protein
MKHYMEVSTRVYETYLKYIAPEDIHVYSIDEVFIDVTPYLKTYRMTPHQLAMTMIRDVLKTTGITATAGIGTNMYLAKVAMDIVAKHKEADSDGVRIGQLGVHSDVVNNYWTQPGDVVDNPKPIYGNPYRSDRFSSRTLRSTDNIRVRDITLGYNIRFKKYIDNMRLYFRTTNPFLIYNAAGNADPDVDVNGYRQTDTPPTRQFLFGLNMTF